MENKVEATFVTDWLEDKTFTTYNQVKEALYAIKEITIVSFTDASNYYRDVEYTLVVRYKSTYSKNEIEKMIRNAGYWI